MNHNYVAVVLLLRLPTPTSSSSVFSSSFLANKAASESSCTLRFTRCARLFGIFEL